MSVSLILIGPPRNSQCKLQSLQAALVCVQSPDFNSLRSLPWLTYKEHDEGHWRKRARTEKGAENLNRKHWASPKPSQLSNCWFLAWKSLLSSPSACLCWWWQTNEIKTASLKCTCAAQDKYYTVSLWEKGWNLGHSPGVLGLTSGTDSQDVHWTFSSSVFCYLEVIVASYFTALVIVGWISAASRKSSCFWAQELFTERALFFFSFLHWVLKKHQSMLALVGRKHPVKRMSGALD